jgi:hypothetical protein
MKRLNDAQFFLYIKIKILGNTSLEHFADIPQHNRDQASGSPVIPINALLP